MQPTSTILGATVAVLLAGALLFRAHPARGQLPAQFIVWECVGQYDPSGNGPTTRNDWITVTPWGPGSQPPQPGCHIASATGGPWSSYADAASAADAIMLGGSPGGINPNAMGGTWRVNFPAVCLRAYNVWRDTSGKMFVTHAGPGEGAILGAARVQSGLCCEAAMNTAGIPLPTAPGSGDCREVALKSQPGKSVALGPGGKWTSLSGPISITPPAPLPPISLAGPPPVALQPPQLPPGGGGFRGTWVMPDGASYQFVQEGNQVRATYRGGRGHEGMTGTFTGTTTDGTTAVGTYTNREGNVSGSGTMTLSVQNGRLNGTWASDRQPGESHPFGGGTIAAPGGPQPSPPPQPPQPPGQTALNCHKYCMDTSGSSPAEYMPCTTIPANITGTQEQCAAIAARVKAGQQP